VLSARLCCRLYVYVLCCCSLDYAAVWGSCSSAAHAAARSDVLAFGIRHMCVAAAACLRAHCMHAQLLAEDSTVAQYQPQQMSLLALNVSLLCCQYYLLVDLSSTNAIAERFCRPALRRGRYCGVPHVPASAQQDTCEVTSPVVNATSNVLPAGLLGRSACCGTTPTVLQGHMHCIGWTSMYPSSPEMSASFATAHVWPGEHCQLCIMQQHCMCLLLMSVGHAALEVPNSKPCEHWQ
jgi:hypothetical protein